MFGLLVLLPLLCLLAAAVLCSSRGPVLFRQRRIGRDGRAFDVLKFRTMRCEPQAQDFRPAAGCAPGGVEGVDRRTRVGRLLRRSCLDELPQLLNVLRGDMSLVGPRPERPEWVAAFAGEIPGSVARHQVRPGMTGLAQVRGLRGQSCIRARTQADLEYVDGWSLRRDVVLLARTAVVVLCAAEEAR